MYFIGEQMQGCRSCTIPLMALTRYYLVGEIWMISILSLNEKHRTELHHEASLASAAFQAVAKGSICL